MKLSIADLVDNCSAEELMIGKEERELTARVKARVLAEIEAESKAAKPKKEIVHIRSRRVITFVAIESKMPGDCPQKTGEDRRAFGRHQIPCSKPGVVHTFLRIFVVCTDIHGDPVAVSAVLPVSLGYGLIRALPVQINDCSVFHGKTSLRALIPIDGKHFDGLQEKAHYFFIEYST